MLVLSSSSGSSSNSPYRTTSSMPLMSVGSVAMESRAPGFRNDSENQVKASGAKQFLEQLTGKPVTIDTFKQAVQDRACQLLDENTQLLEVAQQRYQDKRSPAYSSLKKAVEKEKELQQHEEMCLIEYMNQREMFEKARYTAVAACYQKDKEAVQEVLKSQYEEAERQYENIKSAILVLHSGFPELSALDIDDVQTDTSNEAIGENLRAGFDRIQEDIVEAKDKIRSNDVPLHSLSKVLAEVKHDPEFSGIQDEIDTWIKHEDFKDKLVNMGTAGLAIGATLLTLEFGGIGGWGGALISTSGAVAGLGGAVYNVERSLDLYDVAQAEQVGNRLSEASLEEARRNMVMACVDLAFSGMDALSAVKTVKGLYKAKGATAFKAELKPASISQESIKNVDEYTNIEYKQILDSGPKTTINATAKTVRSPKGRVIGEFLKGEHLTIIKKGKTLYGGNKILLDPKKTTTLTGVLDDVNIVARRGESVAATKMGANPGGINILRSQKWAEFQQKYAHLRPDQNKYWANVTNEFWEVANKPWLKEAINRGDNFRLVSDFTDPAKIFVTKNDKFILDANGNKIKSIFGRELDLLREKGYKILPDGTAVR